MCFEKKKKYLVTVIFSMHNGDSDIKGRTEYAYIQIIFNFPDDLQLLSFSLNHIKFYQQLNG